MNTFQTIIKALEFSNKPLAIKCLVEMKNRKIIFSPGIEQPFNHLYNVYKMRYQIAQELKTCSFNDEEMAYWSKALDDLEHSNAEFLSLSVVQSEAYVYCIFLNPNNSAFITIFGGQTKKPLTESIAINNENFERGLTVSDLIYESGKMIHEGK